MQYLPISVIIVCSYLPYIHSHGRLIEPPSRASAWRYGFSTPHNYNDHELYCGGFTRQWVKNEGKCGVCGDAWDTKTPRAHEFGGTYGQGVIVRNYKKGQVINVRVELTASHMGYFEFAVCPNYKSASQACLNKHILKLAKMQENVDHRNTRYFPKDGTKVYEMKYRLPTMECLHCLLQWRYVAGNNWGNCENGTGAVGCGPQEEFRACADISVGDKNTESVDYNEIPDDDDEDGTVPDNKPTSQETYSPVSSLVVSLMSFLVIFLILCLIYFHYYQIGSRVKVWVMENPFSFTRDKFKNQPPMPPPRGRRSKTNDGLFEVNLKQESAA